jgi:hypothetical protein
MRKTVIVQTTKENAPILKWHLPPNVTVAGTLEPFDRDGVDMRLEGDGLPEWCYVANGQRFVSGVIELLDDGSIRLTPGSGLPVQQVPEKFKTP